MTSKEGMIYHTNTEITDRRFLVHLDGKLYIRNNADYENPIKLVNKDTLSEINDDGLKAIVTKSKRNLDKDDWNTPIFEITKEEDLQATIEKGYTGPLRRMTNSPLFTDGKFLCLLAQYFDKAEFSYATVEFYDPHTLAFKKSVKLVFEPETLSHQPEDQQIIDETEYIKYGVNNQYNINTMNLFSNGTHLIIVYSQRWYFFSLETGIRSRVTFTTNGYYSGYDHTTNSFWTLENISSLTLRKFTIDGFHGSYAESNKSPKYDENYGNRVKDTLKELSSTPVKMEPKTINNLLHSLLKSKNDRQADQEAARNSQEADTNLLLFSILDKINNGCLYTETNIKSYDSLDQGANSDRLSYQISMFRSKFSTTVNLRFFLELTNALKNLLPIFDERPNEHNIIDQYLFTNLVNLVYVTLRVLERLELNLDSVLQSKTDHTEFLEILDRVLVNSAKISDNLQDFNDSPAKLELVRIWEKVGDLSRNIQFTLLNFASDSSDEGLIGKIDDMIEAFRNNDYKLSHGVFLKYLSMTSTLDTIGKSDDFKTTFAKILHLFEALAERKTDKIISHLKQIEFDQPFNQFTYDSFDESAEIFMKAIVKRVLIVIYSPCSALQKATSDANKKLQDELNQKINDNKNFYNVVFNKMTEQTSRIFLAAEHITKTISSKCEKLDSQQKSENKENAKDVQKIYDDFHSHLFEIAVSNNKLLDFIHIYVAVIASDQKLDVSETVLNMCNKTNNVLEYYTKYCHSEINHFKPSESATTIKKQLSTDLVRFLTWTLSKISYELIRIEKNDAPSFKKVRKLINSQLLSGGLEPRYYPHHFLLDHTLKGTSEEMNKHIHSVLNPGENADVDTTIGVFHWNYERNIENVDGDPVSQDEARVVRCVFANALKLSNLTHNFIEITEFVNGVADSSVSGNVKYETLFHDINSLTNFKRINKLWAFSLNIRNWFKQEVAKISEEYEKKAKENQSKEDKKADEKEENEKNNEEEKIDTTKAGQEENTKKESESKATLDDKLQKEFEAAKEKIITAQYEKAEFLLKFETPNTWNLNVNSGLSTGSMDKSKSTVSQVFKPKVKNTLKRYGNHSKSDDCAYIVSCIIDYYEKNYTTSDIKENVDKVVLNGVFRNEGFKIMKQVIATYVEKEATILNIDLFISAIRKGSETITSYNESLLCAGHKIAHEIRTSFFGVYSSIIQQLSRVNDDSELAHWLLN